MPVKKVKLTARERLDLVVDQVEEYEARQAAIKKAKAADKKEAKEEAGVMDKAGLPELRSFVDASGEFSNSGEFYDAAATLEQAFSIRQMIGRKPDHKKGTEGYGLYAKLDVLTEQLMQFQNEHHLQGLRTGRITFVAAMQDGRTGFSQQKCRDILLLKGVDLDVINMAFEMATSAGDPFLVRTLKSLDEAESEDW